MAATRADIKSWFHQAEQQGASHMLVVCDSFDWEDYPVFCPDENVARLEYERLHGRNMQRVMEVYKVSLGWESQSRERVHNW